VTTEQIASAQPTEQDERSEGQAKRMESHGVESSPAAQPPRTGDEESPAQLLESGDINTMMQRWQQVQVGFVHEPRQALEDADALVTDLVQRLARMFATEREKLESQWSRGDEVSTEDLRVGLQRYRSFFQRLLSV
jgi:hypothetical protein